MSRLGDGARQLGVLLREVVGVVKGRATLVVG